MVTRLTPPRALTGAGGLVLTSLGQARRLSPDPSPAPDRAKRKGPTMKASDALLQAGINLDQATKNIDETTGAAADLCALIVKRATSQAMYDNFVNVPAGIIQPGEVGPESLRRALPGVLGTYLEWDITAALRLCADILTDVNAHTESAKVLAMIPAD